MALSSEARRRLEIALASAGYGKEVADLIDSALSGGGGLEPTLAGANVFTGTNQFTGACDFTGTNTHEGLERFKRYSDEQATDLVAGDFALSGGFGTTASVAVAAGSKDGSFSITVTSAGTGQGANPTVTLTFKDGAYGRTPFAVVCRGGGSQLTVPAVITAVSTTTLQITLVGTPVAAETYVIKGFVKG